MKKTLFALLINMLLFSCKQEAKRNAAKAPLPIAGTWQLITGTVINKGDTTITNYTKNISFIKIINDTHFAFLQHDLHKWKDSAAVFVAGGGHYSLTDSSYTEHLEYCSDRQWESNDFTFTISIKNDTLIQSGIEKVEGSGISRMNTEKYIRLKK